MKPLTLLLQNIGPFRTEKIDFTILDDIFLVTGKTGSGKTTIFDAMTYALYGDISGSGIAARLRLRSDFCDEKEKSFVEFTFLLNSRTYKVYRSVMDEHRTRNGTIAKGTVDVTLETLDSATGLWSRFDGTPTQLTTKIISLIGLSKEEFTQIVVLPQGEFAKFLHEGSNERRATLSKLFPVQQYDAVAQKVALAVKAKKETLDSIAAELTRTQSHFDEPQAEQELMQIQADLLQNEQKRQTLTKNIETLSSKKAQLTSRVESAQRSRQLNELLSSLKQELPAIEALELQTARSDEATSIADCIHRKQNAFAHLQDDTVKLTQEKTQLGTINDSLARLEQEAPAFEEKNKTAATLALQIHDVEERIKTTLEKTEAEIALRTAKEHIASLYRDALGYESDLSAAQQLQKKQWDAQQATLSNTETMLVEAQTEQLRLQQLNAAAALSPLLAENEPCPVCGSLTHPHPALPDAHALTLDEKIDTLKKQIENSRTLITLFEKESLSLQSLNEMASSLVSSLQNKITQHHITIEEATGQKHTSVAPSKETLARLQSQAEEAAQACTKEQSLIDALSKPITVSSIANAAEGDQSLPHIRDLLTAQKTALDESYASFSKELTHINNEKIKHDSLIQSLTAEIQQFQKEYDDASRAVQESLAPTSFGSEEAVLSALMPAKEAAVAKKKTAAFRTTLTQTETELTTVTADESELPQLSNELSLTEQTLVQTTDALESLDEQNRTLTSRKTIIDTTKAHIASLIEEQNKLLSGEKALFALNDDLNGSNPKHLQFQSWVLGTFLNDIVSQANSHFLRISDNRYRFVLQTDSDGGRGYKGLELTVSDSYTGKERDSTSLSGGETFMASLSLALALTDVVQQKSGGIRLDSLFIDEGFGSLDSDSLDNAIAILEEVREQRMVGIISHVESLEQAIPSHITVTKTGAGSTISQNDRKYAHHHFAI